MIQNVNSGPSRFIVFFKQGLTCSEVLNSGLNNTGAGDSFMLKSEIIFAI
ncbi:hypothetical protein PULV_a2975 [Pseudoalteromonas ulvae UL12]|nr:hypothetical protein [Pseudoalteromonas ulvae UL12]